MADKICILLKLPKTQEVEGPFIACSKNCWKLVLCSCCTSFLCEVRLLRKTNQAHFLFQMQTEVLHYDLHQWCEGSTKAISVLPMNYWPYTAWSSQSINYWSCIDEDIRPSESSCFSFPIFYFEEVLLCEKIVFFKYYQPHVENLRVLVLMYLEFMENLETFSIDAKSLWRLLVLLRLWVKGNFLSIFFKLSLIDNMPNCQDKIMSDKKARSKRLELFFSEWNLTIRILGDSFFFGKIPD